MRDGTKGEIRHIHNHLKHKNRRYIEVICPDIPELQEIADKAKEEANEGLSEISLNALYQRYRKWSKDPLISPEEEYYHAFLSQVAFDIALQGLHNEEKILFEDSCSLTVKFN